MLLIFITRVINVHYIYRWFMILTAGLMDFDF